jgi:flagellar biosynthesis/type III secretory pathway protein FliH
MNLSDAFEDVVDIPDLLELTVRVYNINNGRNREILEKSKSLSDYAAFIGRVKENRATGLPLDKAITEAVKYCIAGGIMKEYLEAYASEVSNMLFTEFNMDDALQIRFEEGVENGMEKGIEKGMEKGMEKASESIVIRMLQDGISPDVAAKYAGISIEKVLNLQKN